MKPQQQLRKKNSAILLLVGLLAVVMLPIASAKDYWPHHSQEKPDTLYEMVPHIVLPKTIQYKAKPMSYSRPGEYVSYTDFPATYTAFPSYVLPYPTQMRSIQQAVYPIIPPYTPDVEQTPYSYASQPFGQVHMIPLATESMAAMRPILILAVPPVQDQEDQTPDSEKERTVPAIPGEIQKPQNSDIQQVQWANPMPLPPGPAAQNSDSCATRSTLDPAKPLQPTPDALAYQGYPQYSGYAQPYAQQAEQQEDAAANPNALGASGLNQDVLKRIEEMLQENPNIQFSAVMMGPNGQIVPIGGFQNPGQQPGQAGAQQPGGMKMSPEQRTQMIQSQLQYIEAMNRYTQQLYAQQAARHAQFYGIPQRPQYQSPFVNPIYTNPYVNPYVNPYTAAQQAQNATAPAAAGTNDSCNNNSDNNAQQQAAALQQQQMIAAQQQQAMMMQQQVMQQQQQQALYNPYYSGYGVAPMGQYGSPYMLVNPYYPMMQPQTGDDQKSGRGRRDRDRGDRERNLVERFREMRSSQEKKMCEAWRAPHYAEDTGMKVPAKEAYPWGYFGSQVGPQTTPNFGGYHNMYYGNSTYPGN